MEDIKILQEQRANLVVKKFELVQQKMLMIDVLSDEEHESEEAMFKAMGEMCRKVAEFNKQIQDVDDRIAVIDKTTDLCIAKWTVKHESQNGRKEE